MQKGWPKRGVENVTCRIIGPPKFNMKPENHYFQCLDVFPWASFLESIISYSGVKCYLDLVDGLPWWGGYGGGRPPAVQPGAMDKKASEKLAYEIMRFLGVERNQQHQTTDNWSWLKGDGSTKTDAVSSAFDVGRYNWVVPTKSCGIPGPAVVSRWTILQTEFF